MTPIDRLNHAEKLAPVPRSRDAAVEEWVRHYAVQALAAHAAFRDLIGGPVRDEDGPTLGYLVTIGVAATSAAVALTRPSAEAAKAMWDLTPELGALNGEYINWLGYVLDRYGVNPADVYEWFEAGDFRATRADLVVPSVQASGRG